MPDKKVKKIKTMKPKAEKLINIIDKGKEAWEQTAEFKRRGINAREELRDKYQPLINDEKNWFKRQVIRVQFLIELKKSMNEISSMKNLHLMTASWR